MDRRRRGEATHLPRRGAPPARGGRGHLAHRSASLPTSFHAHRKAPSQAPSRPPVRSGACYCCGSRQTSWRQFSITWRHFCASSASSGRWRFTVMESGIVTHWVKVSVPPCSLSLWIEWPEVAAGRAFEVLDSHGGNTSPPAAHGRTVGGRDWSSHHKAHATAGRKRRSPGKRVPGDLSVLFGQSVSPFSDPSPAISDSPSGRPGSRSSEMRRCSPTVRVFLFFLGHPPPL